MVSTGSMCGHSYVFFNVCGHSLAFFLPVHACEKSKICIMRREVTARNCH